MAESKKALTELEKAKIVEKSNQDLEDYIANLKPKKYDEGWPEDRWREEMEKHPLFMSEELKEGEEVSPLVEALQQLKYDSEEQTPEEQAKDYKEEGNEHFKREKYRWALHSYTAGIEAGSEEKMTNAQLYCNRSMTHIKIGNYKKGLNDAKEAKKLDPEWEKPHYRGALCLFYLGDVTDCLTWCENGLQIKPEDKSLLELKAKAEKSLEKANTINKEAAEKEMRDKKERDELFRLIVSRGVTLADNVIDIHEVMSDFPHTNKVYVKDNELVWPVTFLYPEYQKYDFIQEFNENNCFQVYLTMMFEGYADWDQRKEYIISNLQVYFKHGESLVEVQNFRTLRQVLTDQRYKVERGIPEFFVTVKNSAFDKHFRNGYSKVESL